MSGLISSNPENLTPLVLMRAYGFEGTTIQGSMKSSYRRGPNGSTLDYRERQELIASFSGVYASRNELVKTLKSVQGLDATQTILDVIIDDGFTASDETPLFVKYSEGPEKDGNQSVIDTNKEIQKFLESIELVKFIESILEDLLTYGEYPVRLVRDADGVIVGLEDDVDPQGMVAVTRRGKVSFFLEQRNDKVYTRSAKKYHMFCIGDRKVRLNVTDFRDGSSRRIPEYIRCGRSVLYPALSKLKRLQVAELAAAAHDLNRVLTPKMVGVSVPASQMSYDLTELTGRYERILSENRTTSTNTSGDVDFNELMASVGRIKVLPIFGDGKGTLTSVDIDQADPSADDTINKLRTQVAMAAGIPPYYLAIQGENAISKTEALKIYSRYSRKLVLIQKSIASSIVDLVSDYLSSKGIIVSRKLIKVSFKSIVNVDVLDMMEYAVASTQVMDQLFASLERIADSNAVRIRINSEKWIHLCNKLLSPLQGSKGLFEIDNSPEVPSDPSGADAPAPGGGSIAPEITGDQPSAPPEETPIAPPEGGGEVPEEPPVTPSPTDLPPNPPEAGQQQ